MVTQIFSGGIVGGKLREETKNWRAEARSFAKIGEEWNNNGREKERQRETARARAREVK